MKKACAETAEKARTKKCMVERRLVLSLKTMIVL